MDFNSEVLVRPGFPSARQTAKVLGASKDDLVLLFFDGSLRVNKSFKNWSDGFEHKVKLQAGEELKSLKSFEKILSKILPLLEGYGPRRVIFVACGGGTVGDFVGFLASVLKRGVRLVQVPSTYLAAIDSAHGGKTALNFLGAKNQLGSFYPAEKILIVKSLLESQGPRLLHSAYGELFKMALISPEKNFARLWKARSASKALFWSQLPEAIAGKYNWVKKDPYERTGVRRVLNLGHSFGHVLEAYYGVDHGRAVSWGLDFALEWSHHRGVLPKTTFGKIQKAMVALSLSDEGKKKQLEKLRIKDVKRLILKDKKLESQGEINFVFLKRIGRPVVEKIKVSELVSEAKRQGWVL